MSSAGAETMLLLVSLVAVPEEAGVALHLGYCFQGFTPESADLLDQEMWVMPSKSVYEVACRVTGTATIRRKFDSAA